MLTNQIHGHIPLTSISDRIAQKKVDGTIPNVPIPHFNHRFKKAIGPLELIPEMYVCLAEFKVLHVHHFHCPGSEEVQSSKKPTSST
jgi:hypothetical protein